MEFVCPEGTFVWTDLRLLVFFREDFSGMNQVTFWPVPFRFNPKILDWIEASYGFRFSPLTRSRVREFWKNPGTSLQFPKVEWMKLRGMLRRYLGRVLADLDFDLTVEEPYYVLHYSEPPALGGAEAFQKIHLVLRNIEDEN